MGEGWKYSFFFVCKRGKDAAKYSRKCAFVSKRLLGCDLVESNGPVTVNMEKLINSKEAYKNGRTSRTAFLGSKYGRYQSSYACLSLIPQEDVCRMCVKGNHMLNNHTRKGAKTWQQAFGFSGWLGTGGVDRAADASSSEAKQMGSHCTCFANPCGLKENKWREGIRW